MPQIDTANYQAVGSQGDKVSVLMPKRSMTADEAMVHAAWLVTIAQINSTITFDEAIDAVQR